MTESRSAWERAGEALERLGDQLRTYLSGAAAPAPEGESTVPAVPGPSAGSGAQGPSGGTGGGGPGGGGPGGGEGVGDVRDALRRLGDTIETALTGLGEAARDDQVQRSARDAARAVGDALSATFEEMGEGLRERFGRRDIGSASDAGPEGGPAETGRDSWSKATDDERRAGPS